MARLEERYLSDEAGDIFFIFFGLIEEEEYKVKQENNTCVYEYIGPSRKSKYMPDEIPQKWKNTKYEETHTYSDKYQKVKRIKLLTSRYIECQDKYNTSWEDEKCVEKGHRDYL